MSSRTCVYLGPQLAAYGFPDGHPFGTDRMAAFERAFRQQELDRLTQVCPPVQAVAEDLLRFHTADHVALLTRRSAEGSGFLDYGDTPAFPGVLEAALSVAGSVLDGVRRIMSGECRRAFVPIAGLHHARRDSAAGFCAINDCGIAIEFLEQAHGLSRIAYVDIDAHHGDGVYYGFAGDPSVFIVDFHEDGHYLYPGSGDSRETGIGEAEGSKMNVPLPPGADDTVFRRHWPDAEAFLRRARPQFILLQAGADSLAGDPITDLQLTERTHAEVAGRLCALADECCDGRLLVLGGGGYNRDNLARAWTAVVRALATAG